MTPYFSYLHNETFQPRRGLMGIYCLTRGFYAVFAFCQNRQFTQTNLYYLTIEQSQGQTAALVLSIIFIFAYLKSTIIAYPMRSIEPLKRGSRLPTGVYQTMNRNSLTMLLIPTLLIAFLSVGELSGAEKPTTNADPQNHTLRALLSPRA